MTSRERRLAFEKVDRVAVRGRQCKFCQAFDHEAPWSTALNICEACDRARNRKRCLVHRAPRVGQWSLCLQCPPPPFLVPVILLDRGSDRERTVYRAPGGWCRTYVRVKQKDYSFAKGPVVLTLETAEWIKTRG